MRATGIVRRIDDLGRVVIPKEIRRSMDLVEGDPVEFFKDTDTIILKKFETEEITKEQVLELINSYMSQQISKSQGTDVYQVIKRMIQTYDGDLMDKESVTELFKESMYRVYDEGR